MADKANAKTYSNDEITVVWKPWKCIHSGICVKLLPQVYDPQSRPWIKPEHASAAELRRQIGQCPSGALSFETQGSGYGDNNKAAEKNDETMNTKVEIVAKGPLLLHGQSEVVFPDGRREIKKRTTAFCRCGTSANKPYCDGSHNDSDFEG